VASTKTVVGVFASEDQASRAVDALRRAGFRDNEISVVGPDRGHRERGGGWGDQHLGDGATWGAGIGGAAGLLASAGALAIPGFGPVLALGPLAATLTAAAGGGLAGGLVDFGIPEPESKEYERQVKEGKFLAVLKTDQDAQRAASCLREQGARDERIE
jgi:hypothetical protein